MAATAAAASRGLALSRVVAGTRSGRASADNARTFRMKISRESAGGRFAGSRLVVGAAIWPVLAAGGAAAPGEGAGASCGDEDNCAPR